MRKSSNFKSDLIKDCKFCGIKCGKNHFKETCLSKTAKTVKSKKMFTLLNFKVYIILN